MSAIGEMRGAWKRASELRRRLATEALAPDERKRIERQIEDAEIDASCAREQARYECDDRYDRRSEDDR